MIIEQRDNKPAFESQLHKELTLQLYQPFAHSTTKEGAGIPETSPSIHLYMSKQQLINFKTKNCVNQQHYDYPNYHNIHHLMQAPYYYSCQYYHSDRDRRRLPITVDQDSNQKQVYAAIYIGDNFSPAHCCNWIEYLYHPDIYKTKKCDNMACHRRFCSKLHANEQENKKTLPQSAISDKDSLFESIKQFQQLKKQPNVLFLQSKSLLNRDMIQAQQKLLKYVQKLDNLDKQEENKLSNIKNQIISLANANKMREKSKPKHQEITKKESKPQVFFERLFSNEKLKIIEDRQHEFKMFRDKDPRKIAAMALEYISAFLNSDGGSIYFGINDDSIVHGLEVDNRWLDQFQLAIDSDGRNHLNPPLIPQKYKLKIIPVVHQKKFDLKVIQIQVFPQSEAQKRVLTLYKKQCYLRMNASNHRLAAADIMEYMRLVNMKNEHDLVEGKLGQEGLLEKESKLEGMSYKELKQYQEQLNKTHSKILGLMRKKAPTNTQNEGNQMMQPTG